MLIRLAADADIEMLRRIYDERLALLVQGDRRIKPAPVQWLGRADGCVWVGEIAGTVAGYISVWWTDSLWSIDHMGLDAHTYHPGLARALFSAVREGAQTRGAAGISVNVPSYDPVEQAFWRSVGAANARRRGSPGYQWMQFSL